MAEMQGLLTALLFMLVLVVGSVLICAVGFGLILLLGKLEKKIGGERKDNGT